MTKLMRQKLCSTFLSVCAAGIVLLLTFKYIVESEKNNQMAQLDKAYLLIRSVVDEVNSVLRNLNELNYRVCHDETMAEMERALFRSQFLKEIGFIQNKHITCTTSGGILPAPIPEPPATYATPRNTKVLTDHPLALFANQEVQKTAIISEQGNYNVVIHSSALELLDIPPKGLQIVFSDYDSFHHVYGSKGIYQPINKLLTMSLFDSRSLYSQKCDEMLGYCVAAKIGALVIWKRNQNPILVSFIIAGFLFWLCMRNLYPFEHRLSSTRYRVKSGIDNDFFYSVYQPIVQLSSERMIGCEVLARYQDRFGPLYPDQFIPLLKEHRLTWQFTTQQFRKTFIELSDLSLPRDFKVSFNLFPDDLTPENVKELIRIVSPYLSKYDINIEIVEDQVLDRQEAKRQIAKLSDVGLKISIDDFGTGYSNLGQLESINCHNLKIDRQFISNIEKSSLLSSLVPQISAIASRLGLSCIAEGIENKEQKELVEAQGIEFGQGWYFGKPMAIQHWAGFIQEKSKQCTKHDTKPVESPVHACV